MQTSLLMNSVSGATPVVGDPIRSMSWFGSGGGHHMISLHAKDFNGLVVVEVSLVESPQETDWFPVQFDGNPWIKLPKKSIMVEWDSPIQVTATAFTANVVWVRARLIPADGDQWLDAGWIEKILLIQ